MSFVLPGNARSLRFTGEAKALAPNSAPGSAQPGMKTAMMALGKPRVRRPTAPPLGEQSPGERVVTPQGATQVTSPSPGIVAQATANQRRIATPVPASGRGEILGTPYMTSSHTPRMRDKFESMSDDVTMALEREDVLPGAVRAHTPIVVPNAPPIFHFRAQAADPPTAIIPQVAQPEPEKRGAPYAVWIAASVIAGLVSFHVAPAILSVFTTPHAHVQSIDSQ